MLMTIAEQLEQKGYEQGFREGFEQGWGKINLEIARSLLQQGISLDIIVTSTGLSRDKIEALI